MSGHKDVWTPANIVTCVRIAFIPVFMAVALLADGPANTSLSVAAFVIYLTLSLTDKVDGYLARSRDEITDFGKFLDPIADKLLVFSALLLLLVRGEVSVWIVFIILVREFLVSALRMVAASSGEVIAADNLGKAKTAVTMVSLCGYYLGFALYSLDLVDLAIMMRQYDVDVLSWDGGWMFSAYEHMFDEYINYWKNIKETSKGGMRQLAKWMLNKLYGKFGSSPENVIKRPSLTEDGVLTFEAIQGAPRNLVYLPVAVWTTAYARQALFDAIDTNRSRFVYCDTDSMHLLGTQDPAGIKLHDTHFCAWKVEGDFLKARHLHAKAYMWYFHKSKSPTYGWQCVCAGATENIRRGMAWEDFYEGYRNYIVLPNGEKVIRPGMGKMRPERVPGGVILKDGFWSIKRLE